VRFSQVGIAAVLRVPVAVIVRCHQLAADVLAHETIAAGILVNVVAEVHHKVEIFFSHVLIRREQADLVLLARCDREAKSIDI